MSSNFIFLAEGFEETEALTVVDLLRRASIEITTVSVTGISMVKGSHAISVLADALFEEIDFSQAEFLILPGGMPGSLHLAEHKGLNNLLQNHNKKNKYIGAICAAPTVLGKLNMLHDREAICYPGFEKDLLGANISDKTLIQDSNIITAKGPGYAVDFGLYLVQLIKGKDKANEVARNFLYTI
jgi:4-methyl-5(b-hydroxyethyl)-thiazole monophosphate biosynthesis